MRINQIVHRRATVATIIEILVLAWTAPGQAEDYGRTEASPAWVQINLDRKPCADDRPVGVFGSGFPSGCCQRWSEFVDPEFAGMPLLRSIGRVPEFSSESAVDERIWPAVTKQCNPESSQARSTTEPARRAEMTRSEPDLLPMEWFTPDERMPVETTRTCCWVPVANRLIYVEAPGVIRVSSDSHYLVAGRVYWSLGRIYREDINRGWVCAYATSRLIIDCNAVVSARDDRSAGPIVIAAGHSDVTGFVSFVAVSRNGEYRMGMISADGKLYPMRPASVNATNREFVAQYAARLSRAYGSPSAPSDANAALTPDLDAREFGADAQRFLSATIGAVPAFSDVSIESSRMPQILQQRNAPESP